jgi:hypothetical protein
MTSALRPQRGGCPAVVVAGFPAALLRTLPASAVSASAAHRALSGFHRVSLFRFLALGLVLAYPGLPGRPQRLPTHN